MKLTSLLPMKGHSERVPNKNMKRFSGKPLYHCVAEVLQNSDFIESIVINTDSNIIAEDATKHFAKVKIHIRPEDIRGDMIPMNDIIEYDINHCAGEHFLQTHSTNPLLSQKSLEEGIKTYFSMSNDFDSVFSVTRWQTRLYWSSAEPINHDPQKLLRTQDLTPVFEENSNFYIFSKESFKKAGNRRIGLKPKMFIMDKIEAIDIDEGPDFKLAETLYMTKK
jgi:CMP-N-acetylneuraminic acid synthetase